LGHVRQVAPSLTVARGILHAYGARLRQVHLSEVDAQCRHAPLSMASVFALSAMVFRFKRPAARAGPWQYVADPLAHARNPALSPVANPDSGSKQPLIRRDARRLDAQAHLHT